MTHQVAPTPLRLNKSLLWKSNTLFTVESRPSNNNLLISSSNYNGIPLLLKHKMHKLRYLVVKTSLVHSIRTQTVTCRALVMPRVKTRPITDSRGIFTRHVLYKPYKWVGSSNVKTPAKGYVDERRLKIFKFPLKKNKHINKWLSRRMLRGSSVQFSKVKNAHKYSTFYFRNRGLLYANKLRWRNNRWHIGRVRSKQRINCSKISHWVGSVLNQRCSLSISNVFYYLAQKQMLGYRSHQEHLWHKRYRKYRFYYDNYYDIVNSLFVISLLNNSETLLLDLLRFVLPRIRKIKRFMVFLDNVLKNMPQLRHSFLCFRILLTGKIRGGTERTKSLISGFGYLPYQTISMQASSLFISYPHQYGEFGIKLILNRTN